MEALVADGRLIAPVEVLYETKKRSDELHTWLKAHPIMFRELDDTMQIEVGPGALSISETGRRKKLRTSADPFFIALAHIEGLQLVTDEKPTGSLARPNIPDVCQQLGMPWIGVLQLIRAEKWVVG